MFRVRRYRIFIVFTAIFVLIVFHFARSRNPNVAPVIPEPPKSLSGPPAGDNKEASPPHGFTPEAPPSSQQNVPSKPDTKPESKYQPPKFDKPPVEKPAPSSPVKLPSDKYVEDHKPEEGSKNAEENKNTPPPPSKPNHLDLESGNGGEGRMEITGPGSGRPTTHWRKFPEHFPVPAEEIIKLPMGKSKSLPKLQAAFKDESVSDKLRRTQRLGRIKDAFQHAWAGYKTSAMGHDELAPLRGGHRDPFNGWGATLVDALDTLWIMDLKEEFSIAVDEVRKIDFTISLRKDIPLFETTIRYLGGLLGAYDISGHKYTALLDKAIELADILIGAFDSPNRMPMLFYKWAPESVSQPHLADSKAVLAEIGSLSIEFTRLAQLTRENKYYDAIARITNELEKSQDSTRLPGLWPLKLDASGCRKSMVSNSDNSHIEHKNSPNVPAPSIAAKKSLGDVPASSVVAKRPAPTDIESYIHFLSRRDSSGVGEDAERANYEQTSQGNNVQRPSGNTNSKVDAMDPADKNCKEGLISAGPGNHTFGLAALADSTYEYMPKAHMLLGGLNEQYHKMYEKAMATARKYLLFQPMVKGDRDLRFLASVTIPKGLAQQPEHWTYTHEGTHLACFAGGMFAVGAKLFKIDGDMDIAAKLTDGCVWAYESTETGIMPESFELLPCEKGKPCKWNEAQYRKALDPHADQRAQQGRKVHGQKPQVEKEAQSKVAGADKDSPMPPASFPAGSRQDAIDKHQAGGRRQGIPLPTRTTNNSSLARRDRGSPEKPITLSHDDFVNSRIRNERIPPGFVNIQARKYLLRPEAIESVFIMYRLTGDDYWREKGWKMFEAVTKYTRTDYAYSAIQDVTLWNSPFRDEMESFWLAETLKYYYLLFSDPSVVSLDEYVLNTEAHPLKRPEY